MAILAQQMAIEYAQARSTFGAPLATRQAVQWMIVENEIDIHQARWVTLDAAWKADRGDRFYTAAAMAKIVATEAAGRVVDRSMQIHGGMGVAKELPLERWYRELRIKRIGEGPERGPAHDHRAGPAATLRSIARPRRRGRRARAAGR